MTYRSKLCRTDWRERIQSPVEDGKPLGTDEIRPIPQRFHEDLNSGLAWRTLHVNGAHGIEACQCFSGAYSAIPVEPHKVAQSPKAASSINTIL